MIAQAINQKEYRRLEKLEALALRGEGGERETAQRKYNELKKKLDSEASGIYEPAAGDDFKTQLLKEQIRLNMDGCKTCLWGRGTNGKACGMCDTQREISRLKMELEAVMQ